MNTRILWILLASILFSFNIAVSQMSHKINFLMDDITFTKGKGEDSVKYDKINLKNWNYLRRIDS